MFIVETFTAVPLNWDFTCWVSCKNWILNLHFKWKWKRKSENQSAFTVWFDSFKHWQATLKVYVRENDIYIHNVNSPLSDGIDIEYVKITAMCEPFEGNGVAGWVKMKIGFFVTVETFGTCYSRKSETEESLVPF
jgi:hypothetical protein